MNNKRGKLIVSASMTFHGASQPSDKSPVITIIIPSTIPGTIDTSIPGHLITSQGFTFIPTVSGTEEHLHNSEAFFFFCIYLKNCFIILLTHQKKLQLLHKNIHVLTKCWGQVASIYSSISTKITEVNLFAFAYRLFHEDFSPIYGVFGHY